MTVLASCASRQSRSARVLAEVLSPDCNLAIWERPLLPGISAMISDQSRDIRFATRLAGLAARLSAELDSAAFANSAGRAAFVADVEFLAQEYCALLDLDELEVRVELVTTNSCRKWHADYVKARLITTYVGTGTQWLDAAEAQRVRHGAEPAKFHTMATGDVGIFKGKLATNSPAVHRSPPIAGTGETRLLVVFNPLDHG